MFIILHILDSGTKLPNKCKYTKHKLRDRMTNVYTVVLLGIKHDVQTSRVLMS